MMWLVLALFTPIFVAWTEGSTYPFAFSVTITGVVLYIAFIGLEGKYIKMRTPETPEIYKRLNITPRIDTTELVPRWVVYIGLTGAGFIPAGIITAILLWAEVIENQGF